MSHPNRKLFLVILAILALAVGMGLTACSDSDDPVDPGGETPETDTTPPVLVRSEPAAESTGLLVDDVISVFFSEDLDPESLDGNITLSAGTITDLVLVGGNEVEIRHDDWDEGDHVIVTFATGLADTSGNNLAEELTYQYWVESDEVTVLQTTPADGATDVLRNVPLYIKFSESMDLVSLEHGIVADIPGKGGLGFAIRFYENTTYELTFDLDIPEDTHVTVIVGPDCQANSGEFLAEMYTFSYDTGVDLDQTIPEIVSFEPANGSEISVNTNTLQITFNEPVGDDRISFVRVDILSMIAMELAEVYGGWNPARTVMTITFGGPLPAGVEMTIQLGDFSDLAGNINNSHPSWEVTVAGTVDHFPVDEAIVSIFSTHEYGGERESYTYSEAFHKEWVDATHFRNKTFDNDLEVWNEWENLIRTSDAVLLEGFREMNEGVGEDIVFDTPVKMLNHPTVTASWSGNVDITTPDGDMNVVFDMEVLPDVSDFPVFEDARKGLFSLHGSSGSSKISENEMFWPNCRMVIQEIEGSVEGTVVFVETDTLVFCPGFGLIKESTHEVNPEDDRERFMTSNLSGLSLFDEFGDY